MRKVVIGVGVVLAGLVALCMTCMLAGLVAAPDQQQEGSSASSGELSGRYDCMMMGTVMMNGMIMPQYSPTGLWFTIDGDRYEANGSDGTVTWDAETVTFSGGGYDGWRGARGSDTIIFRKEQRADPRPGVNVQFGDLRCGKH